MGEGFFSSQGIWAGGGSSGGGPGLDEPDEQREQCESTPHPLEEAWKAPFDLFHFFVLTSTHVQKFTPGLLLYVTIVKFSPESALPPPNTWTQSPR